ncbi:MAG: hypothetical protein GXX99_05860 [Clostridiales bacterium]|nr:hypothetical protein [Clostridiales bacterium]
MKLYGNKVEPRCTYCEFGTRIGQTDHINCIRCGVVTDGYTCPRFRYDPLKRVPPKLVPLPAFREEDFEV